MRNRFPFTNILKNKNHRVNIEGQNKSGLYLQSFFIFVVIIFQRIIYETIL